MSELGRFVLALAIVNAAWSSIAFAEQPPGCGLVEPLYRVPLKEAGQSGVCVQGDRLYLTIHKPLTGALKGGHFFSSDIVGQCFDKHTGKLLWEVDLPGSYAGRVLESWHDSTSLLPVADEHHVVFHNLNGKMACYSPTGELRWKRDWLAPDPDIKNSRMFLHDGCVIVALPSDRIAVAASKMHPALPFYQLRAIELATGRERWVSPTLLSHATQYSLDTWRGRRVIVASIVDLSHWKFRQGQKGYLLSLDDGRPLRTFDLPAATIPHHKNQLCDNHFLATIKAGQRTVFQWIDPDTSAVAKEIGFEQPDENFSWNGATYSQETPFVPKFADKILRGDAFPTPSTVHVVGDRIYFWRYDSSHIGCIDLRSGKSTLVEVPIQCRADATVWNVRDFKFTSGIFNAADKKVSQRFDTVRGVTHGGFGHTNPAWPTLCGSRLFWQGGAGLLYIIDTEQPFSPAAITWHSTDGIGNAWTFGEPGLDDAHLYIRSQRDLVRFAIPKPRQKTETVGSTAKSVQLAEATRAAITSRAPEWNLPVGRSPSYKRADR
jgi:hypothetical protein